MDITFETKEELYNRIKPALTTKKEEMIRNGFIYITEDDIWNFLIEIKWKNSKNLSLYDVVNDILNIEDYKIDNYLKNKLNKTNRNVYFDNK